MKTKHELFLLFSSRPCQLYWASGFVLLLFMIVHPGTQRTFGISLIGTKHLLIGNETLQDCAVREAMSEVYVYQDEQETIKKAPYFYLRNAHVVYTHEHTSNEPSNCSYEEQRADNAIQLISNTAVVIGVDGKV